MYTILHHILQFSFTKLQDLSYNRVCTALIHNKKLQKSPISSLSEHHKNEPINYYCIKNYTE